jgi:RNA polymerase sigma-70 factor (ECF subfamily)
MNPSPERTSHVEPDDAGLVRSAQAGDEKAFAEIVRRYQRQVYRIAYGLTRRPEDADDLAQETFVRAYRAIGTFRVGEPLSPWLSRITVNLAYSLFRRRKRRPETSLEPLIEAGQQWAAEGDDPVEEVAHRERLDQVRERFAELSSDHQAILVLRVVEGLSYEDISRTLNVPIGTVMSRLSRARAELKAKLASTVEPEDAEKKANT